MKKKNGGVFLACKRYIEQEEMREWKKEKKKKERVCVINDNSQSRH